MKRCKIEGRIKPGPCGDIATELIRFYHPDKMREPLFSPISACMSCAVYVNQTQVDTTRETVRR